jgi:hypothetical protein
MGCHIISRITRAAAAFVAVVLIIVVATVFAITALETAAPAHASTPAGASTLSVSVTENPGGNGGGW